MLFATSRERSEDGTITAARNQALHPASVAKHLTSTTGKRPWCRLKLNSRGMKGNHWIALSTISRISGIQDSSAGKSRMSEKISRREVARSSGGVKLTASCVLTKRTSAHNQKKEMNPAKARASMTSMWTSSAKAVWVQPPRLASEILLTQLRETSKVRKHHQLQCRGRMLRMQPNVKSTSHATRPRRRPARPRPSQEMQASKVSRSSQLIRLAGDQALVRLRMGPVSKSPGPS